jgi:hypothetical protein
MNHICNTCERSFSSHSNLHTHLQIKSCIKVIKKIEPLQICDFCNKVFKNRVELINHIGICNK